MRLVCLIVVWVAACATPASDTPAEPFDFIEDVGPTFVEDASVGEDGLILNRLVVVLTNDADADMFAAALAAVDGQVASSLAGFPWLTVTIPPVADLAAAQQAADTLSGQPGVRRARPAWLATAPKLPETPEAPLQAAPSGLEGSSQAALGEQRFYAAWNAAPLASTKVLVWVVDFFTKNEPLPQLSAQRFVGAAPQQVELLDETGEFAGNHGFWVTSLLGADIDERVGAGTHPAPSTTLDVVSLNLRRTGDNADLVLYMGRNLPLSKFFVLNTSFGFDEKALPLDRTETALAWRELLAIRGDLFLHTTSAGNEGYTDPRDTDMNSIFSLQAAYADLRDALTGTDRETFEGVWNDAVARTGERVTRILGHTLPVGSSNDDGSESGFSNRGAPARMIGQGLMGVCDRKDRTCRDLAFGRLMLANGTSGAAPQAAGLAAWLRSIDPTLDAAALRERLLDAYNGRWIDALSATLALESPTHKVREAMLDYFPGEGFNGDDITALLAEIDSGDAAPADAFRTWPKADLNGDGYARRESRGPFDLDGDGSLGSVTVKVPGVEAAEFEDLVLDEASVSDLEILCWGAFAGPYTGLPETRDELLAGACQPVKGFTGQIVSTIKEECMFGERTTTFSVNVTVDEAGELVSVGGTASFLGTFSNVSPGDCVAHESFGGPFVMEGDGSTSSNQELENGAGYMNLVYLKSGTISYTGLDNCGDPRIEELEAWTENFRYQRAPSGAYDFAHDEVLPSSCTKTISVTGVLR